MVIAAEQHASRLVVPAGQCKPAIRWSSHKDHAAKALRKLAGPHLPASLTLDHLQGKGDNRGQRRLARITLAG